MIRGNYEKYLECALDALFSDTTNNGFWNEKEGRIIYGLDYITQKNDNNWIVDNTTDFRFGPFGLMGALYWRYTNPHSNTNYDLKMKRYLDFLANSIQANGQIYGNNSGFEHGIVLATLALGSLVFKDLDAIKAKIYLQKADSMYEYILKNWTVNNISNNHDLFILWGFGWLYDAEVAAGNVAEAENIKIEIFRLYNWMHSILDGHCRFLTGDFRASYHQRMMYPLWGFAKAVKITNNKSHLRSIERSLDYVLRNRMDWDGAFIWHPPIWLYKKKSIFKWRLGINPFSKYLFECHQTFFINAVEQYYRSGGKKDFFADEIRAIEWIFSTNRRGKNMVEECGIGVPWRMMNTKGRINVRGQAFKGTYELGSYIMALSDIVNDKHNYERGSLFQEQNKMGCLRLNYKQFRKLMKELYLFNFKIDFLHKITGIDPAYCFIYAASIICLKIRDGEKLLDVGSLKTCLPQYIAKKGGGVTIIDTDERVKIQSKYSKNLHQEDKVRILLGDARKMPFKNSSFDAVNCTSVLQHIPSDGDVLAVKEIARVLKPGGRVFISVSYAQFPSIKRYRGQRWIHRYYDYSSLNKRVIEPSKLKVKEIEFLLDHKSRRITNIIYNKFPKYIRLGLGWSYLPIAYYFSKRDNANKEDADACYIVLEKALF